MPKRKKYYDLWEGFPTFPRLLRAFYRAARSKFDREAVLRLHHSLEANLFKMQADLVAEKYQWGKYRRFWVIDPKLRLIESAPFRDRIVHHALVEVLEPILEPTFYFHSYACRSGRGTHAAVKQLQKWISLNPQFYFLQMDVTKFFPSIDRKILFEQLQCRIGDEKILHLVASLLQTAPGENGIPIGNLTSQLFANLYLDALDQFIKRELKVPFYIRYMDDFVLLSPDRDKLKTLRSRIEEFGNDKLKLKFHPNKVLLGKISDGVSFVGFRSFPEGVYMRGRSTRRFRKRMKENMTLDQKVKRYISYKGHLKHAKDGAHLISEFQKIVFCGRNFMSQN